MFLSRSRSVTRKCTALLGPCCARTCSGHSGLVFHLKVKGAQSSLTVKPLQWDFHFRF